MTRTYVIQAQNGIWPGELIYAPYYVCTVDAISKKQAMQIFNSTQCEEIRGKYQALSVKSLGRRAQEWIENETPTLATDS